MLQHVKNWWMAHLGLLAAVVTFLSPAVNEFANRHAPYAIGIMALWGYILKASKSPIPPVVQTIFLAAALFMFPIGTFAQTPTPPAPVPMPASTTFSITASGISLPGNKTTTAGMLSGVIFQINPSFALKQTNFVSSDGNTSGFFGGFTYTIPKLSLMLNNASPAVNGYDFQFYVTASAGVDRITAPGPTQQHYSYLGGGGVNYAVAGSKQWSFGIEVQYAKLPGLKNNTVIVSLGPTIHF